MTGHPKKTGLSNPQTLGIKDTRAPSSLEMLQLKSSSPLKCQFTPTWKAKSTTKIAVIGVVVDSAVTGAVIILTHNKAPQFQNQVEQIDKNQVNIR